MRNTFWAALILAGLVVAASCGQTETQDPSPTPTPTPTPTPSTETPPRLVFQKPADGVVLTDAPVFIQVCFANPINIQDLHLGGDFAFGVTDPEGSGLGLRIVFQPDGYGAAIYPGAAVGVTTGEWNFRWRVTSPDGGQASEGESTFTVGPDGEQPPQATPPRCVGERGTATPPSD